MRIVSSTHATLKKEERVIVNNLPARQIIVETPDHTVVVDRFLMMDNYLVQVMVAGSQGVELQPNTKRFVEFIESWSRAMMTVSARSAALRCRGSIRRPFRRQNSPAY